MDDSNLPDTMSGDSMLNELEIQWMEKATELLAKDEDSLFLELGKFSPPLPDEAMGALPTKELLIRRSREWLEKNRVDLCRRLARSERIRAFVEERRAYDKASLAVIVAGVIVATMSGTDLPVPLTVAVIITRLGIESLCGEDWCDTDKTSGA